VKTSNLAKNIDDFCMLSKGVLSLMSKWFAADKLELNLNKTNMIKFTTINVPQRPLSIGYNDKFIEKSAQTKFLGLQIYYHLNWKNNIVQLILKLSGACYISATLTRSDNIEY
jgi:hypothetical protein